MMFLQDSISAHTVSCVVHAQRRPQSDPFARRVTKEVHYHTGILIERKFTTPR